MESHRSSFSQHNTFEQCIRTWYYSSILKIPQVSDMCYANAGNAVHKPLDKYYKDKWDIERLKKEFDDYWNKYKLNDSKIKLKKDEYWVMCLNAAQHNVQLTSTELKIYYPEIVAYLDITNTDTDTIADWKTSTRDDDHDEEYKKQLLLYGWLYYRKFERMPKQLIVYYLKYSGSKGIYNIPFTEQDIHNAGIWYNEILEKMNYYIANQKELPPFNTNYFWCPYKSMWGTEDGEKIKFTLHIYGNYVQLDGPVTPLLEKGIVKKFSYELKDAFFIKKRFPQAKTTIEFWNSKGRLLPIGFRDGLLKTLQDYAEHKKVQLDLTFEEHRTFDNTIIEMPDKFINDRILREYQNEAVEVYLRKKIGILELATGAGKTEIAIELIRRLKMKTLFIVDKIELMKQTIERIHKCLGIEVGQIGGSKENIKNITVATIQTLNKNPLKYSEYLKSVRFVIFDETHKVASKSYVKVSKNLIGTEFRLGLSGTAWRNDGNDMQLEAVTGNIIHAVNSQFLIQKGFLVKPRIIFIKDYMSKDEIKSLENDCKLEIRNLENSKRTGLINETVELSDREKYGIYYSKFIHNSKKRNNKTLELIHKHKENKVLILTKLVDHGVQLQESLGDISRHLYGETPKNEREQIMKDFQDGKLQVLISTISIWSEGLDMPSLQTIINVSANKGDIKTIQVLGRVLRILEGKSNATYIDFLDDSQFFRNASFSRKKALRKQGHDIEVISDVV